MDFNTEYLRTNRLLLPRAPSANRMAISKPKRTNSTVPGEVEVDIDDVSLGSDYEETPADFVTPLTANEKKHTFSRKSLVNALNVSFGGKKKAKLPKKRASEPAIRLAELSEGAEEDSLTFVKSKKPDSSLRPKSGEVKEAGAGPEVCFRAHEMVASSTMRDPAGSVRRNKSVTFDYQEDPLAFVKYSRKPGSSYRSKCPRQAKRPDLSVLRPRPELKSSFQIVGARGMTLDEMQMAREDMAAYKEDLAKYELEVKLYESRLAQKINDSLELSMNSTLEELVPDLIESFKELPPSMQPVQRQIVSEAVNSTIASLNSTITGMSRGDTVPQTQFNASSTSTNSRSLLTSPLDQLPGLSAALNAAYSGSRAPCVSPSPIAPQPPAPSHPTSANSRNIDLGSGSHRYTIPLTTGSIQLNIDASPTYINNGSDESQMIGSDQEKAMVESVIRVVETRLRETRPRLLALLERQIAQAFVDRESWV